MRLLWTFAASLLALWPHTGAAQSVAELYAKNCVSAAQKASSGCKALESSLPKKSAAAPARSAAPAAGDKWGALADVAGGIWHSPGTLYSFDWETPRKLLRRTSLLSGEVMRYTLDPAGMIVMTYDPGPAYAGHASPFSASMKRSESGSLSGGATQTVGEHTLQTAIALARNGDVLSEVYRTQYTPKAPAQNFRRLDGAGLATLKDALARIATPEAIARNWGLTAQLAGKTWVQDSFGTSMIESWAWREPGLSMIKSSAYVGDDAKHVSKPYIQLVTLDPLTGTRNDSAVVLADGGLETKTSSSKVVRYMAGSDKFKDRVFERKANGEFKSIGTLTSKLRPGSMDDNFARYLGREREDVTGSGGGGFMAALSGAIMGAATGYADAGDVGAIAGAIGGAAIGKAGGNDALYQQMEQRRATVTAQAAASERSLATTIARAQQGTVAEPAARSAATPAAAVPVTRTNTSGAPATARAQNVASAPSAAEDGFARYVWCFARRSVMGKQGDQHYSNIRRVFIPYKLSHEQSLEDRVRDRWAEYLQQFQNMSARSDYQMCRLYESEAQARSRLEEEMVAWRRLASVNATLWDPRI